LNGDTDVFKTLLFTVQYVLASGLKGECCVEASELQYPVLALMRKYVYVYRTPEHLLTAYLDHVKAGSYNDVVLVDKTGASYDVVRVSTEGISWVRRLLAPLVKQTVRISVDIRPAATPVTFEYLKRYITKEVGASGNWEIRGADAEFFAAFERANTISELMTFYNAAQLPM
jgi:hypothetical protein